MLEIELYNRKKELKFIVDEAINRTAYFGEPDEESDLTYDEKCNLLINKCTKELSEISKDYFMINLQSRTYGEFGGHLSSFDVDYIKKCLTEAKNKQNEIVKSDNEKRENFAWLDVGVLFATEEINQLKIDFDSNSTKIAKFKFGENWKRYRPYISSSIQKLIISDKKKSEKNIFSNNSKLEKIKEYCLLNKIPITQDFINKIKPR